VLTPERIGSLPIFPGLCVLYRNVASTESIALASLNTNAVQEIRPAQIQTGREIVSAIGAAMIQVIDETPEYCASILGGAWTEAEWDSFLSTLDSTQEE